MEQLTSYVAGEWYFGNGKPRVVSSAITGEALYQVNADGMDSSKVLNTEESEALKRFPK